MSDDTTFLRRVVLSNYRSIAACDVRLGPLRFLVGPNGSGKSNFLDALRFVADSLQTSVDHALRERGGIAEVRRRSRGHPNHFGMRLEFALPYGPTLSENGGWVPPDWREQAKRNAAEGHWAFRIGAREQGGYEVQEEQCILRWPGTDEVKAHYHVRDGKVIGNSTQFPLFVLPDRLSLASMLIVPEFYAVFEAFSRMGFYNLNPDEMRELQAPDPGDLLRRDGSNLAAMLARLRASSPWAKERIEEYLAAVVPGVEGVDSKALGPKETLEFRQKVAGDERPWRFLAASMSDGTLRALGVLVALFQSWGNRWSGVSLVGIEEPESALHPAAAGVLRDSLRDASHNTQVIVTSHSPDLLDDRDIEANSILAVVSDSGTTRIGPLNEADRSVLRDHLFTAGELLRLGQLVPDGRPAQAKAPRLFDPVPA